MSRNYDEKSNSVQLWFEEYLRFIDERISIRWQLPIKGLMINDYLIKPQQTLLTMMRLLIIDWWWSYIGENRTFDSQIRRPFSIYDEKIKYLSIFQYARGETYDEAISRWMIYRQLSTTIDLTMFDLSIKRSGRCVYTYTILPEPYLYAVKKTFIYLQLDFSLLKSAGSCFRLSMFPKTGTKPRMLSPNYFQHSSVGLLVLALYRSFPEE